MTLKITGQGEHGKIKDFIEQPNGQFVAPDGEVFREWIIRPHAIIPISAGGKSSRRLPWTLPETPPPPFGWLGNEREWTDNYLEREVIEDRKKEYRRNWKYWWALGVGIAIVTWLIVMFTAGYMIELKGQ